ncbi:DUF6766 family protein [Agromyces salentinus]|uniref:Uncharacterized protein n=1 Tax=Agromyces salentinus TaxID=269421 RepID=A0ABN2N0D9_9MICO|nr:DUF6766 family protein [Agromyces salentinus]
MRIRQHALSIFFAVIFVAALIGQAVTGLALTNEEQASHGLPPVGFGEYLLSSQFVVDVAENWQSEYLQFFLFILTTIWLVQRGSPESKKPGDEGIDSDEAQLVGRFAKPDSPAWAKADGWKRWIYSNSLLIVMGAIFLLSWLAQSIAGMVALNAEQAEHGQPAVDWAAYLVSADFWNRTLQNWQSEFLAVGSMVALSIFLRQRGSAESKPVGTPHEQSSVEAE